MKRVLIILSILFFGLGIYAQEESLGMFYIDAYVVVSDTSKDYDTLRNKMFDLNQILKIDIDTLRRGYDKEKNLICLPKDDDDDDELYAESYYPRRYPSESLSLEYLSYYTSDDKTPETTIALVVMIAQNKKEAKKRLAEVKKYSKNAFMLKSKIYIGCMH